MENISLLEKLILESDHDNLEFILNENLGKDELKRFKIISSLGEKARKKIRESAKKRIYEGIDDIIDLMKKGRYENL